MGIEWIEKRRNQLYKLLAEAEEHGHSREQEALLEELRELDIIEMEYRR